MKSPEALSFLATKKLLDVTTIQHSSSYEHLATKEFGLLNIGLLSTAEEWRH